MLLIQRYTPAATPSSEKTKVWKIKKTGYNGAMKMKVWLARISDNDRYTVIARKAGINPGTFKGQYDGDKIPPHNLVKIARTYGRPALEPLVLFGLITEEEAGVKVIKESSSGARTLLECTDEELLMELMRRVQGGSPLTSPQLFQPLDGNHPTVAKFSEENKEAENTTEDPPPVDT